jgi:demethylmenaquinone methyltransferase/2-methoxy-6-polyprenyl-1,4-benzoquinol methylase
MVFSKQEVQDMYQSGAKYYDLFVRIYPLIGLRMESYRSRAVDLLRLKRGDSVVELGCGTGLNFPRIIEAIGPEGQLIGVDLTPGMLACAHERVEHFGWKNVELIQSDIAEYNFPEEVNRVLSIGVFGFVAEYNRVIEAASHALVPGGRLVIGDGKKPEGWPLWLLKLFVCLSRPFGLTLSYLDHRTWESVERYFQETALEERYGGLLYISSGTAPSPAA